MLNRRILRIKVFKVLYGSVLTGGGSLAEAEAGLDVSCEATRDLYVFMLGIISPLTRVARERLESARRKFNPTEEERNPNMKFADNALARLLDEDPDFGKAFSRRKFSWEQYDLFLKEILSFNDAGNDMELLPGTVVYLQRKKRKASSHVDKYITEGMESLRDVSQRFAVRLKSLRKINGFSEDHILKPGDTILLR